MSRDTDKEKLSECFKEKVQKAFQATPCIHCGQLPLDHIQDERCHIIARTFYCPSGVNFNLTLDGERSEGNTEQILEKIKSAMGEKDFGGTVKVTIRRSE